MDDKLKPDNNDKSTSLVPSSQDLISRGLQYIGRSIEFTDPKVIRDSNLENLVLIQRIGEGSILASAVSPDGSLVVVSTIGGLFIHVSESGERIAHIDIDGTIRCIDISPDNQAIVIGKDDGSVLFWEYKKGDKTTRFNVDFNRVNVVRFTPDSLGVIIAYSKYRLGKRDENGFYYWGIESHISRSIGECKESTYDLRLSHNGNYFVERPSAQYYSMLWDFRNARFIRPIREHGADEMPFFSPDSKYLGTKGTPIGRVSKVTTGEVVEQWNLIDTNEMPEWIENEYYCIDQKKKCINSLEQYTPKLYCLAFAPDDVHIAAAGDDNRVRIWNAQNGYLKKTITLGKGTSYDIFKEPNPIMCLSFSPDGKLLAVGRDVGIVSVVETESEIIIAELSEHYGGRDYLRSEKICVEFSPDGKCLATSGSDGKIRCWKVNEWQLMWEWDISSEKSVNDVTFSFDNKLLIVGHKQGPIKIIDVNSGRVVRDLHLAESIPTLPFSNKKYRDSYCVICSRSNVVIYSDLGSKLLIYEFDSEDMRELEIKGRPHILKNLGRSSLSVNEDIYFLGGLNEGKLLCLNLLEKAHSHEIQGHISNVTCTSTSHNGHYLASGGEDGVIIIWGVDT